MALEVLDTAPDWERYRTTFENASRRIPRLRQKVVMPTLPTAAARWVVDPDFNLDYHVRRMRVPEPGTLRQVFDMAEVILQSPLDISRPLWSATLIEGLAGGRAAQLLHLSHAVTDGVGFGGDVRRVLRPGARSRTAAARAAADSAGPLAQRPDAARGSTTCPAPSSAASATC